MPGMYTAFWCQEPAGFGWPSQWIQPLSQLPGAERWGVSQSPATESTEKLIDVYMNRIIEIFHILYFIFCRWYISDFDVLYVSIIYIYYIKWYLTDKDLLYIQRCKSTSQKTSFSQQKSQRSIVLCHSIDRAQTSAIRLDLSSRGVWCPDNVRMVSRIGWYRHSMRRQLF